jgi:hypothetical protein
MTSRARARSTTRRPRGLLGPVGDATPGRPDHEGEGGRRRDQALDDHLSLAWILSLHSIDVLSWTVVVLVAARALASDDCW